MMSGVKVISAAGLALLALCSCGKGGVDSYDYVTIEYVQAPVEEQDVMPSITFELPEGFHFRDTRLSDGDVARLEDHLLGQSYMLHMIDDLHEFGIGGFVWPDKNLTLMVNIVTRDAEVIENGGDDSSIFQELIDAPLKSTIHSTVRGRTLEFGDFSGTVFYTRINPEMKEKLLQFNERSSMPDNMKHFVCCSNIGVEEVLLSMESEDYVIIIRSNIYGEDNSVPEMMDIVIRIAESIRIID